MDFISDFWTYSSCYQIPRNFSDWTAISLTMSILNRKVYYMIGDNETYASDYVLLVSNQGLVKKSTCLGFASRIFQQVCPKYPIGASTQSAEDIVKVMSKDDFGTDYTDERGDRVWIKPYTFFVSEFKNFIAYNPIRMLNFLTDLYDCKFFKSSTIARNEEAIVNPSITMLACENPEQLSKFMKTEIMSGGFSRRIIIVYHIGGIDPVSRPVIHPAAAEAWKRVVQRCVEVSKIVGPYSFTEEGGKYFDKWYHQNFATLPKVTHPMLAGYLGTKDVHLMKVCMALDAVSDNPTKKFTPQLIEKALTYFSNIEPNMPKLYAASGRNELIGPQMKALDILKNMGGQMSKKQWMRTMENDMTRFEISNVISHLSETDQIYIRTMKIENNEGKLVEREVVMTVDKFNEKAQEGKTS